jgi:hypothetical protein
MGAPLVADFAAAEDTALMVRSAKSGIPHNVAWSHGPTPRKIWIRLMLDPDGHGQVTTSPRAGSEVFSVKVVRLELAILALIPGFDNVAWHVVSGLR